ncbi:hypothetical protein BD779DRAFT_770851 [Infundibulicybe gibba]|nr:hypothetical protein BD779DRAFT_770851 [Infundibulicybe gibba]
MDDGGSYHFSGVPDLLGDFEAPNLTVSQNVPQTASTPGSSISALPPSSYSRLAQFRSPKTPVVLRKPPGIKLHAYMRSALMDKETGGQTWGEESYPSGLSSFATLRPYQTPLESLTEEAPGEIHVPPSSSPPEFSSPASPGSSSPLSDSSPMYDKLVSKSHCSGLSPETSPLREGENDPAISQPSTDSESSFPFHRDEFSNRLYALLSQAKMLKDEIGDEMSTSTAVQATQDANFHVSTALFANLSVPEPEDASCASSRSEER